MGFAGVPRRPAQKRCAGCLGHRSARHVHDLAVCRSIYIADFSRRCAIFRGLRFDLFWTRVLDAERVSHAEMELGKMEQAIPVYRNLLEWVVCRCTIQPVGVAC